MTGSMPPAAGRTGDRTGGVGRRRHDCRPGTRCLEQWLDRLGCTLMTNLADRRASRSLGRSRTNRPDCRAKRLNRLSRTIRSQQGAARLGCRRLTTRCQQDFKRLSCRPRTTRSLRGVDRLGGRPPTTRSDRRIVAGPLSCTEETLVGRAQPAVRLGELPDDQLTGAPSGASPPCAPNSPRHHRAEQRQGVHHSVLSRPGYGGGRTHFPRGGALAAPLMLGPCR